MRTIKCLVILMFVLVFMQGEVGAQGGGKFRQVADENCDTWLTNRAPL